MNEKLSKRDLLSTATPFSQRTRSYTIYDKHVQSVVENLISRSNVGQLKYGTTLERTDLEFLDWINHLQEELMDATLYLEVLKNGTKSIPSSNQSNSNLSEGTGTGVSNSRLDE